MNRLPCATLALSVLASTLAGQDLPDPKKLAFRDGVARIDTWKLYHELSYQGPDVMIDQGLRGIEYVKFNLELPESDNPILYFINTKTHRGHPMFMRAIGIGGGRGGFGRGRGRGGPVTRMRGVLAFRPLLVAPNGETGLFTIEFEPNDAYAFKHIKRSIDLLNKYAPITKGRIAYYPLPRAKAQYEKDKPLYDKANIPSFFPEQAYADIGFLPLNRASGYGRLRLMDLDERPGPRDVVLYKTLPNEMPRVAGVITAVRQTPLSHVNLRAVQDGVPNAFVRDATAKKAITALIGKYVHYKVTKNGYELKEASAQDVARHFSALRPANVQTPVRDLAVKVIRKLDDVGFGDAASVGVKAANLAVLRKLGFPEGTVPNGVAVPFYFYDEFMKHNGFYGKAEEMQARAGFATDAGVREKALSAFRAEIRKGTMPAWMLTKLAIAQESFGDHGIRCRSSTNNEDLSGFSGAGLYDSCTHRGEEGHIAKSIKQVYASLWNFRAYEERTFYRIDHATTAMGVLMHPNFDGEKSNGVAVADDIVYQSQDPSYYVNVQVGEDLVTNPDALSVPEEILLGKSGARGDRVVTVSSRVKDGTSLLSVDHRNQLRRHLGRIQRKFRRLYKRSRSSGKFAMEIEFKIDKDDRLVIKQARPWVYSPDAE